MRVLLIGNGPSALSKELGNEIDNFQGKIIRFNNYNVGEKYSKFVGTRTDIWATTQIYESLMSQQHEHRWLISLRNDEATEKTRVRLRATQFSADLWKTTGYDMGFYAPSSGALMTSYFLDRKDEVWIYGFNYLIKRHGHHYNKDTQVRGEWHDEMAEWIYFNRLLDEGKIRHLGWDRATESIPIFRWNTDCGTDTNIRFAREPAHKGWYEWFATMCAGKTVLDAGAGTCESMKYLEATAKEVHGFDIDERLSGLHPNLTIGSDLSCYGDKSFDVVVAVDVIEHIIQDLVFFNHLKRIAREKVLITTPNFTRSKCGNGCHCREFSIAQFQNVFQPSEIWSASPDGSIHKTRLLEKMGRYIIDHSAEGPDNEKKASLLNCYVDKVPLETQFNQTVDLEEWGHIAAIFKV